MYFPSSDAEQQLSQAIENNKFSDAFELLSSKNENGLGFADFEHCFMAEYKKTKNPENWTRFLNKLLQKGRKDKYFSKYADDVLGETLVTELLEDISKKRFNLEILEQTKKFTLLMKLAESYCPETLYTFLATSSYFNQDILVHLDDKEAKQLIVNCIFTCNAHLLNKLKKSYENQFKKFISELTIEEQEQANWLLNLNDEQKSRAKSYLSEFVRGLSVMNYDSVLLACAQIQDSKEKKFLFRPTVLKSTSEFNEYMHIVKKITPPTRQRFILIDEDKKHSIVGDIKIDKNGHAEIFILDSLGSESVHKDIGFGPRKVAQLFAKHFPDHKIYSAKEVRQFSSAGCKIFATTDAERLSTIEDRLEDKYKNSGLFGYLADKTDEKSNIIKIDSSDDTNKKIEIHSVPTPLALTLTMQKELVETIQSRPKEEQETIISQKKSWKASDYASKYISGERNTRLTYLLNKMAKNIAKYLKKLNLAESAINNAKNSFTLEGFKMRYVSSLSPATKSTSQKTESEEENTPKGGPQKDF